MNQLTMSTEEMMRLLDGVRDPRRLEIIFLLGKGKPMNVRDISDQFQISRPAISHHLKVLKDARILRSEKIGQEIYYRLDREVIVAGLRLIADTIENCCVPSPS
jgi:DNA-binding transcriptional ArsR family regulator